MGKNFTIIVSSILPKSKKPNSGQKNVAKCQENWLWMTLFTFHIWDAGPEMVKDSTPIALYFFRQILRPIRVDRALK
jgi:hypothetical protein